MKNDPSRVGAAPPFPPSLRDAVAPAPPASIGAGGVLDRPSALSFHEAAHCLARRYLGLPLGGATIVPGPDFGGLTYGHDCDAEEVSAATLRDDAERLCAKVLAWRPAPGETRDKFGFWLAFIHSEVITGLAGREAETLAGYDPLEPESRSTDVAVAKLYAEVLCISHAAITPFLAYCSAEAREILKAHWPAVEAIARALEEHQTLAGDTIDEIIFQAEADAVHETELRRREAMADMLCKVGQVPADSGHLVRGRGLSLSRVCFRPRLCENAPFDGDSRDMISA